MRQLFIAFSFPGLNIQEYYSAVGVPAGIFAILMAFMTERLSVRQVRQEDLAIQIYEAVESDDCDVRRKDVLPLIRTVLTSRSSSKIKKVAKEFISWQRGKSTKIAVFSEQSCFKSTWNC